MEILISFINKMTAYLTIPLAIIVVYAALMRYVFHAMPDWAFEASIFIFGIQVMFGSIYCHARHKHVSVDILQKYLSEQMNLRLNLFFEMIIFSVTLLLSYVSYKWALDSFLIGERSMHQTTFNPPIWWFKAVIPISTFLLSLQCIVNFRKIYSQLKGRK